MKTKILVLSIAVMMLSGMNFNSAKANDNDFGLYPEKKTETVKVYGNCGMCKTRIEKAAKGIDGVKKADWDRETKELTVTYDSEVTNLEAIEKAIADVGHDTENARAKDEVYNELHSCCKYDRPEK